MSIVLDSRDLRERIAYLDPRGALHEALETRLRIGPRYRSVWYVTQQEHWLGWLRDHDGPGYYERKNLGRKTAEQVYNRINCAPMLAWLDEASGVSKPVVARACRAVPTDAAPASQCGAFRRVVPWALVEQRLTRRDPRPASRR